MNFIGAIFTLIGVFTFPRLTFGIVLICFGQVALGIIVIVYSFFRILGVSENHAETQRKLAEYEKLKRETSYGR
jgi:hypothetical protein